MDHKNSNHSHTKFIPIGLLDDNIISFKKPKITKIDKCPPPPCVPCKVPDLKISCSKGIAIGESAGLINQQSNSIAIGCLAGCNNQNFGGIALGYSAGLDSQNTYAVAIGYQAGLTNQGTYSIGIGYQAGTTQHENSIILNASGSNLDSYYSGLYIDPIRPGLTSKILYYNEGTKEITYDVFIDGSGTAQTAFPSGSNWSQYIYYDTNASIWRAAGGTVDFAKIHLGCNAGQTLQGRYAVAIGGNAGNNNQGTNSIAIGLNAGQTDQSSNAIAIGSFSGNVSQCTGSIAIGFQSGSNNQKMNAIAIGLNTGNSNQGPDSISIGNSAGQNSQGTKAISIGSNSGQISQGNNAIAIGSLAGQSLQSVNAIAIGNSAGSSGQGNNAIAIGFNAGLSGQGLNSIAIGLNAGSTNQVANSIVLNASGTVRNPTTASLYVDPIRPASANNILYYDSNTKEITYDISSGVVGGSLYWAKSGNGIYNTNTGKVEILNTLDMSNNDIIDVSSIFFRNTTYITSSDFSGNSRSQIKSLIFNNDGTENISNPVSIMRFSQFTSDISYNIGKSLPEQTPIRFGTEWANQLGITFTDLSKTRFKFSNDLSGQFIEIYVTQKTFLPSNNCSVVVDISSVSNNSYLEEIDSRFYDRTSTVSSTFGPHMIRPQELLPGTQFNLSTYCNVQGGAFAKLIRSEIIMKSYYV